MGQEIHKAQFDEGDFNEFTRRLKQETGILKQWFKDKLFECDVSCCGFELEAWLVDKKQRPVPQCIPFLEKLNDPNTVPEVSLFNFEYNSSPHSIKNNLLTLLEQELSGFWKKADNVAAKVGAEPISIGILPTLKQSDLLIKNLHPNKRYKALNAQIKQMLHGKDFHLNVAGKDSLNIHHDNLLIETVSTSLQIHLQLNASKAVRYYNIGFIIAAPMIAITANSPFLFQKHLWEETRIPVFEQVIDTPLENHPANKSLKRVTFGNNYVQDSIFELFEENLHYPVLLPELINCNDNQLGHLKMHNGTIWRWNRPIIDSNAEGVPHIRLEHRVAAAGTSSVDIIASIAFFLGLMRYFAYCHAKPEEILSFKEAKSNFYHTAQYGLDAVVCWKNNKTISMQELILQELLPRAKEGLKKMELDSKDINFYLDEIIKPRVQTGITGSEWQRQVMQNQKSSKKGFHRFCDLVEKYIELQKKNIPVHEWPIK